MCDRRACLFVVTLLVAALSAACQGQAGQLSEAPPASAAESRAEESTAAAYEPLARGSLVFGVRLEPAVALDNPSGVDVDGDGRVFVLDAGNDRVVVFASNGVETDVWGEDDLVTLGFGGLAVAEDGRVYVVDNGNHRIQVFEPDGQLAFDFGSEGDGDGQFQRAIGIAVFDDEVYVTDDEIPFVQVFALDGSYLRRFGGLGAEPGFFLHATGIEATADGVFVADFDAARVQRFSSEGDLLGVWQNPGPAGTFEIPEGIAVEDDGTVVVSGYRSGNLSLLPDEPGETAWTIAQGDLAPEDRLRAPTDVAIGADGTVYVTDQRANAVVRFVRS